MLHFYAYPIAIGYLIAELWRIFQCQKHHKTKELEHCFYQYLKPISPTSDSFLLIISHIQTCLQNQNQNTWPVAVGGNIVNFTYERDDTVPCMLISMSLIFTVDRFWEELLVLSVYVHLLGGGRGFYFKDLIQLTHVRRFWKFGTVVSLRLPY